MTRVAGLAQMADNIVGMQVDGHAGKENRPADIDIRFREPVIVEAVGRDEKIHPPCIKAFNVLNTIPMTTIPNGIFELPRINSGKMNARWK